MVPVQNNRTLEEIKAIAGEAGMDAAAVEAAALELGAPESDSLPLIGRSPRMELTCAVEGALDEEDRRELVAILQRALDAGGRTRETLRTLEWRHFGLLGRELVVVTARKGTTTIEVRGRYRRGLVATFLAGGFPAGLATAGLLDFANLFPILDGAAVPLVLGSAFFVGRTLWNWFAAAKERTLRRLTDPVRYGLVLKAFIGQIGGFGFNGMIGAVWLLITYGLCVWVRPEGTGRTWFPRTVVTLGLVLAGHAAVFVATADDVARLLNSSLERLLLQLWPVAVFSCFIMKAKPATSKYAGQSPPIPFSVIVATVPMRPIQRKK
jgi:hypothetical protein